MGRVRTQVQTTDSQASRRSAVLYAVLAGVFFVLSCALFVLVLIFEDAVIRHGLTGRLYFVALVPTGLSAAFALFGALKSYARYKGKVLNGWLELGGPVVIFFVVLFTGKSVGLELQTFDQTVYVLDAAGQPPEFHGQEAVTLYLGRDSRSAAIGNHGEAYFRGIPSQFRNQDVRLVLQSEDYELTAPNVPLRLDGESLAVTIRRKHTTLRGQVMDAEQHPIQGAHLRVDDRTTTTNSEGWFTLELPESAPSWVNLRVTAEGYLSKTERVSPKGDEIDILLQKEP